MTGILRAPRKLERQDDRTGFDGGAAELDDWFRRFAWENQRANNVVTYVVTVDDLIVGYYAIAAAGVSRDDVPLSFGERRPSDVPCVLLARLTVDRRAQGCGIGAALFRDAIARAVAVSEGLGAACLLVHCRDEEATRFYLRLADMVQSPLEPMHLILPMKAARGLTAG